MRIFSHGETGDLYWFWQMDSSRRQGKAGFWRVPSPSRTVSAGCHITTHSGEGDHRGLDGVQEVTKCLEKGSSFALKNIQYILKRSV